MTTCDISIKKRNIVVGFVLRFFYFYENKKKKKRKKKPNSLSSLHEKSEETPGALDRHDWESQEAIPLPRTILSALVHITGYRRSGCRPGCQESIVYGEAQTLTQTLTRLLGRQMFRTQSASEHTTSTSRQNCVHIQYLNSSGPAETGCAHLRTPGPCMFWSKFR